MHFVLHTGKTADRFLNDSILRYSCNYLFLFINNSKKMKKINIHFPQCGWKPSEFPLDPNVSHVWLSFGLAELETAV